LLRSATPAPCYIAALRYDRTMLHCRALPYSEPSAGSGWQTHTRKQAKCCASYALAFLVLLVPVSVLNQTGRKRVLNQIGRKAMLNQIGGKAMLNQIGRKRVLNQIGRKAMLNQIGGKAMLNQIGRKRVLNQIGRKGEQIWMVCFTPNRAKTHVMALIEYAP